MPFQKGRKRTGGKPKGHTSLKVADVLNLKKFNPVIEMLKIYPTLPDQLKIKVCIELQSYIEAKPKPKDESDPIRLLSTQELVVLVKDKLPELESALPVLPPVEEPPHDT